MLLLIFFYEQGVRHCFYKVREDWTCLCKFIWRQAALETHSTIEPVNVPRAERYHILHNPCSTKQNTDDKQIDQGKIQQLLGLFSNQDQGNTPDNRYLKCIEIRFAGSWKNDTPHKNVRSLTTHTNYSTKQKDI